jgi:tetratricopeptide (TPR) repeat protein
MKMKNLGIAVLSLFLASAIYAQAPLKSAAPAEQKIAWAEAAIKAHPDRSQPYNELAVGYVNRVRETANPGYYDQAEAAVHKSLELTPDNLEGQKARVMILLGRGDFAGALDLAKALNKKTPDDVLLYGFIADAAIELGEYADAEKAVQWMLDLRPGNVPALLRGAILRRLYGDSEGAMLFFSQAYQQMPPTQTEDLAWTLTQMADLQLSVGHIDDSEGLLRSALQKFPRYYLAQESLARVQTARQRYSEAVELLRQRNLSFPTAASRYALAESLEHAGQISEAKAAYQEFETSARRTIDSADNANEELIFYYLAHGHGAAEALRIARIEIAKRHDVNTLDAYAWALYSSAHYEEAQKQIARALTVGVRDAAMLYHAGAIAESLKDSSAAERFLKASLELNPSSETAGAARGALEKLAPASADAHNSK